MPDDIAQAYLAERERAEQAGAAIARVRGIHRESSARRLSFPGGTRPTQTWCVTCATRWPCDTIRALDGADS